MRSILVTPNLLGHDGISCLSRQLLRALPQPAVALTLHDACARDERRRSAGGSQARFLAEAGRLAIDINRETRVVCSHIHLAAVARAMAWRGAPFVQVLCGIEAWVPLRRSERWALESSRLVAISRHTTDRFKTANPAFDDARIEVCHPGLPIESMPVAPVDLPVATNAPAALIVGRMARDEGYKGHEALIALWPRVHERHPDARLWIVGDGDDRARLESISRAKGLETAVTFTGRISDQALSALYQRCRFVVLPSRDEGFGFVFLEAMRAGKACIGARGAAEEIIDHGRTGLVVDPAQEDQVLDAMLKLLDDPARCEAYGRAGAARFAGAFTDVHFAHRLAPVLSNQLCEVAHACAR